MTWTCSTPPAERLGSSRSVCFISGANIRLLPGLQQALRLIYAREASFEAVAVDQLSRLSRGIGDTDAIVKRLRFFGVRLIAVSDGLDTADDTNKISVTLKSLVNEIFLDDLRKTTKRGLDGQFLEKYSTGGRTSGIAQNPHTTVQQAPIRAETQFQPDID
jgi:DNA invertase Pin-like site-specific DNA recombinase